MEEEKTTETPEMELALKLSNAYLHGDQWDYKFTDIDPTLDQGQRYKLWSAFQILNLAVELKKQNRALLYYSANDLLFTVMPMADMYSIIKDVLRVEIPDLLTKQLIPFDITLSCLVHIYLEYHLSIVRLERPLEVENIEPYMSNFNLGATDFATVGEFLLSPDRSAIVFNEMLTRFGGGEKRLDYSFLTINIQECAYLRELESRVDILAMKRPEWGFIEIASGGGACMACERTFGEDDIYYRCPEPGDEEGAQFPHRMCVECYMANFPGQIIQCPKCDGNSCGHY